MLQYIEFRLIGGYGYRQFLDSVVKSEFRLILCLTIIGFRR